MRRMIIFDDGRGRFGPMTDLRASFELRTGMLTTARRIEAQFPKSLVAYWAPPRLRPLLAGRADAPVNEFPTDDETLLLVNGRWALPESDLQLDAGQALIEEDSGHVIAAVLRRADAEYLLERGELHERVRTKPAPGRALYRYPWDIIALAWRTIAHDILATRIVDAKVPDEKTITIGEHPVEVHEAAQVFPNVVFDATHGPITVHENAVIRPGAILCGPCSVGRESTVIDRAHIKPNTAIGPCCKVGGEVGATIFQGYSNKSHDGHLGDSWVGRWVNLGAGTTNSNLLNTYGEVTMRIEPGAARQRTGLTFLGAIIGDHVKTAINTRIMTGTVIGTGAMIASTAPPPTTTRRFAWLTDDGERICQLPRFIDTARAMMSRRRQEPSQQYLAAIEALYNEHAQAARDG